MVEPKYEVMTQNYGVLQLMLTPLPLFSRWTIEKFTVLDEKESFKLVKKSDRVTI